MINYVITLAQHPDNPNRILLILKNKPDYLKGKLNLVGGKIESNESPEDAAARELKEEAGLTSIDTPILCGKITNPNWTVYCLKCEIADDDINPGANETEEVNWYHWDKIQYDPRLMPNLKVIIPLLHMEVKGWEIKDSDLVNEINIKL